jgi:hypothetical protein
MYLRALLVLAVFLGPQVDSVDSAAPARPDSRPDRPLPHKMFPLALHYRQQALRQVAPLYARPTAPRAAAPPCPHAPRQRVAAATPSPTGLLYTLMSLQL